MGSRLGSRVLVTGGTGAFGSAVVDRLHRMGVEVVALARREPPKLPTGVRFTFSWFERLRLARETRSAF